MNNIYTKSQKLMDVFLNSVSDQDFLNEYLALEKFQGPLVKDFLMEVSFSNNDYTIVGRSLDLGSINTETHTATIHHKNVKSNEYGSSYAANDEKYSYNLSLAA